MKTEFSSKLYVDESDETQEKMVEKYFDKFLKASDGLQKQKEVSFQFKKELEETGMQEVNFFLKDGKLIIGTQIREVDWVKILQEMKRWEENPIKNIDEMIEAKEWMKRLTFSGSMGMRYTEGNKLIFSPIKRQDSIMTVEEQKEKRKRIIEVANKINILTPEEQKMWEMRLAFDANCDMSVVDKEVKKWLSRKIVELSQNRHHLESFLKFKTEGWQRKYITDNLLEEMKQMGKRQGILAYKNGKDVKIVFIHPDRLEEKKLKNK